MRHHDLDFLHVLIPSTGQSVGFKRWPLNLADSALFKSGGLTYGLDSTIRSVAFPLTDESYSR